MIRPFSPLKPHLRQASWLCALALFVSSSMAATPAAGETASAAASTYSTKGGDTVERVIKNAMPDSPLNPSVLRKALADANPKVVTGKAGQRFKAGIAINLPEHAALVRNTLEVYAAPGSEGAYRSGYSASDPASRRHWIRYP